MHRLLQYLGVPLKESSAEVCAPRKADVQPLLPERYDGVALGVECAWPMAAEREVRTPAP